MAQDFKPKDPSQDIIKALVILAILLIGLYVATLLIRENITVLPNETPTRGKQVAFFKTYPCMILECTDKICANIRVSECNSKHTTENCSLEWNNCTTINNILEGKE